MKRNELKKEVVLSFEGVQYEITETLGIGATCIAYKAKRQDGTVFCLKECYPDNAKISRNETQSLVWTDASEREAFLSRFRFAYNKMKELYSINEIKNSSPIPIGCFEENETIYYLSDLKYGKNFEDDIPDTLSDIITVGLTLSKLIKAYHSKGYLHLDIKPENIFLMPETREMLVLFDVDSIIPINDLKDGLIKSISFSKDFSAPEQRDFNISKISEQTDFYAIGSTLFYKIMGRKVCSFDRGIFADWNFSENKYFENINPKTQNAVAEFFKKTLSLNPKDRFVDTDSLIDALKEIKDLSEEKVYIDMQSSLPASISSFVGRKKELEKIETAFSNGKRMIFLQGFGGIGKSELAKKYASIHESEYNKVIFLKYSASLKDTLNQINIHTMEETSFDEKEEDLKKLLTSDCLLIIDNFNVDIYADDYLDELAKYTVNIIFTTRTDFSEYDCETAELINIDCLDKETLLLLFLRESALIEADDEDLVYILKTLKLYQYHTLFVRPLAHKIKKRRYTPRKLYDISKKDFLDDKQISPVRKDGKVTQETLNSLAKKLFRLENLNPFEQQVLSDLYILNDIKADIRTYADIICADISQVEKENTLISLVENGVVQEDELNGGLSIHPIIMELVNELFKPDVTSCSDAAKYINTMVDAFLNKKLNSPEIPVTVIRSSANFPLHITNLLSRLDMSISENSDYALDLIFKICSSSIYDYLARQFRDIISAFDKEDIRVKLLNFLCEFTSMFNKSLSAHTAHREEEMVEYIVSFHKEYDDGSDLFGCIFWQMILFYYDYLQNFKSMGWNISLLAKIQKCIKTQNKFGLSLYEYVFDYTNFEVAYIDENENMVDEGNYIFAAENIEKIFTQKQLLAKELGINTEGKTSFEIYMDCIEKVCSDYKNSLIPYVAKHQSNTPFSEDELSAVKTIYEKIKQDDFLTKQMKLDIYLWCCNLSRHLNYLPPSKDTSNPLWDLPLTPVLSFFVKSGLLDEKKELLPIIREFLCVLESGYVGTPNDIDFASKTFFSSFLSDFDKFKKEVERFIEKEITKAKEKINENERVIIFNFPFAPILHKAITEEKAFILSSLLNDYFYKANSLYEKHGNQITFINLDIILSACMNCANAAFKETGEDIYKKEYAKLEKCLKKEY